MGESYFCGVGSRTLRGDKAMARRYAAGVTACMSFLAGLALLASTVLPAQAQDSPTNLTTWTDLDGTIATAYAGIPGVAIIYPPGPYHL